MNRSTVSAECMDRIHSQCDYEDCACRCHLRDHYADDGENPQDFRYDEDE